MTPCYPPRMSETYDPEERRREKQASRDEDARRLAAGEVTPAELARENSPFSGLRIGPIDYSRTGLPRYRRERKQGEPK